MTLQQLVNGNAAAQAQVPVRIRRWPRSSPFHWLLFLPPVSKGRAGMIMVEEVLRQNGYSTARARGIGQSLKVTKGVLKVKLSLLWDAGTFAFEQIEDDSYDYLAMLGLQPQDASLWICPKAVALANAIDQHGRPSKWVVFPASSTPSWLSAHGGSIATAASTIRNALGPPP